MKTDAGKRMRHTRAHRCLLAGLLLLLLAAGIHLPARGGAPLHTPGTAGFTLPALPEDTLEAAGTDTIAPRRLSRAERRRREAAGLSTADSLQRHNEQNLSQLDRPIEADSLATLPPHTMAAAKLDSVANTLDVKKIFIPDSKKATWLAAIFPGAGQIYNRKFWKLPIIYGGFLGCAYALSWNTKYYNDYSQAYLDIMDDDPKTDSYLDFLPLNYRIEGREEWLKTVFKNKKNAFRRQRDLSIFAFIGVYIISIIDAYVDAELSSFDITPDITFHLNPAVGLDPKTNNRSVGLQCSVNF